MSNRLLCTIINEWKIVSLHSLMKWISSFPIKNEKCSAKDIKKKKTLIFSPFLFQF